MQCLAVFALILPGLIAAAEPPPKIPLRDFFKNPLSSSYLLSPDGNTLSYLAPWETRMNIFIRPTAGGEAKRITSDKERDIRDYFWKGNQFVVYAQDNKGDENFHLFRIDLKTGEVKDLTPFPKVRAELVDDLEDISEHEIVMMMNKRNAEAFDAYRLNVVTGEMKMTAKNPGRVDHWVTDHKGRILAATESDGVNATLLTRPDEKAPFKKVLSTNFRERVTPEFYSFDNKEIYATSNIGRDKVAIIKIDPATAKETETIYENPEVDVDGLAFSKKPKELTKPVDVAPCLKEGQLTPMKPIEYKSRDGLIIHGYLTLPLGRDPKNLPTVMIPHGGPWARDEWGYDPEVQFLANPGYAVLQVNFRGSTGYGRKFWEASFKQWGKTMQDDLTDGVQWLIKQGIADPRRIAIYGGSYGGYATLAGVAYTPDLYAAAVDYVGISNLFTFMKTIPPYWKPFLDQMHEMVGDPEKDKDLFTAMSPALNADKIKTPLFVAQGAQDPRVNKAESDQIVQSLRKRGVDVEYMVKDNEGHGFSKEEYRFAFYEATEAFLAKHLKQKS